MAMTNAERQRKFRERQKAKAAAGADAARLVAGLTDALAQHHAAWGLPRPGDARATIRREMYNMVRAALRSDLLLGYPYHEPAIDTALHGVINYLLDFVEMRLEHLPNPAPADILALYPEKKDREALTVATGRDWDKYATGASPAPLTLSDRLAFYWCQLS